MARIIGLEELSRKHAAAYSDYDRAFKDEINHLRDLFHFKSVTEHDFNRIMRWYRVIRLLDMKEECERINKILVNATGYTLISDIDTAHRIYVYRDKSNDKILGSIDVHCLNDEYLLRAVPDISCEIRPDERKSMEHLCLKHCFVITTLMLRHLT